MKNNLYPYRHCLSTLALAVSTMLSAQTFDEWRDPNVNEVNRLPMHTDLFVYESSKAAQNNLIGHSANTLSLHGSWNFHYADNVEGRATDFWRTDFDDSSWDVMPIPAVWEMYGYGQPIYAGQDYAWKGWYESNPPLVPTEHNHVGSYRRWIEIPSEWKGKEVIAHFGSVTSCLYLWVNGHFVGYGEDSKLGQACIDSWSAQPLPEYQIPYRDYTFIFLMRPCRIYQ